MTYIAQRLLMFQRYSLFFFISILYTLSLEVYSQSVCPTKHPLDVDGQFKISTLNNTIDNRFCVGAPITILDPPSNTNIAVTGYIFEYQDPAIPYKDYEKKYPAKIAKSANGSATYTLYHSNW
jgi:hypothetical protein